MEDRTNTSLGTYRINRKLGAGGMGEVYEAVDERLGRTVAIKVLRPEVMADIEHRSRFEREAKALAALKHPGIVTIYAFEEIDGVAFFVMDMVEGRTLTSYIEDQGALSVSGVLELAIPISDAIATAHKQGIAHRDIKPDNIIVGERGKITVLDFGLAKNRGLQFGSDETVGVSATMPLTVEGRIFGTVNYMAPEQAEGGETTLATDVFSLGVVIYEMATGDLPFKGETPISVLSSILKQEPIPISQHDKAVPPELERIVSRCLEKDPDRRWQSALDVRNELELLRDELGRKVLQPAVGSATGAGVDAPQADGSRGRNRTSSFVLIAGVLFGGLFGALIAYFLAEPGEPTALSEDVVVADPGPDWHWTYDCLTSDPGMENAPSLSPDGEFITFSMRSTDRDDDSIYLLRVDGKRPIELTAELTGHEESPRFSPDGKLIAFRSGRLTDRGSLYVMGATGESKRRINVNGFAPDWSPDGKRLVCSTEGYNEPHGRPTPGALVLIDLDTRKQQTIFDGDAVDPRWSPDGEWILFWTVGKVEEDGRFNITGRRDIGVIRPDGTDMKLLTDDIDFDWSPIWADNGSRIIFSSNRGGPIGLWEIDFDSSTGTTTSKPRPIPTPSSYAGRIDATSDGRTIVYVDGMGFNSHDRVPIDLETMEVSGLPERVFHKDFAANFDVSPDGERIYVNGGPLRTDDLYVARGDGSGLQQLTDDPYRNLDPVGDPDGQRVHFFSNRSGDYEAWTCFIDGGGFHKLTEGWSLIDAPSIHPDDEWLAITVGENWYRIPADAASLPLAEAEPMPMIGDNGWLWPSQFSDDGQWLLGHYRNPKDVSGVGVHPLVIYDVESNEYEIFEPSDVKPSYDARWAPDQKRILLGTPDGVELFDPSTGEITMVVRNPVNRSQNFRITDNGYIYYCVEQDERDIWIARQKPLPKLERFGSSIP